MPYAREEAPAASGEEGTGASRFDRNKARYLGILQDAGVAIDYFDIILHEPSEERAMTKTNPTREAAPAPVARGVRLAGSLECSIEELTREERAAIAGGDWAAATSRALERASLREAHHRTWARRRI
jgi:hypothetical protein